MTAWIGRRGALLIGGAALAAPRLARAQPGPLRVSVWGGSFRDLVAEHVGKRFTAATGVPVTYQTGGTIDRLTAARLARANPEADVTFTTSHVGWLYANDGLFERIDPARVPNAGNLVPQARISPFHVGTWAYVYTIGWRPDLLPGMEFTSWEDLWRPELRAKLAAPDFDPSHLIAVAAKLAGGDASNWEVGQPRLRALRPNFRAFYTNDANSQQLLASGETPVQVILSMNAHHIAAEGVDVRLAIPREGGVLGVDTVAVMRGSRNAELAWRFLDAALDPAAQAAIAADKKGSPTVTGVTLPPAVAALPGVFTTPEQWRTQTLVIDDRLRAEKTAEWRRWFQENVIAG